MKKKIKAWAVLSPEGELHEWGDGTMLVYSRQTRATGGKKDAYGRHGRVVRCTITYETLTIPKNV